MLHIRCSQRSLKTKATFSRFLEGGTLSVPGNKSGMATSRHRPLLLPLETERTPGEVSVLAQHMSTEKLKQEQQKTLSSRPRPYGLFARLLFFFMDLVYGRRRSLKKSLVLEIIARVPYQAWEDVSYIAMTHTFPKPQFARRIFDFVRESRSQQDNEQWHMFILEEMLDRDGVKRGRILFYVLPQIIAFAYYHVSWILYVIRPGWSYALNADFEDHAEREYMEMVREHPQFETKRWESDFKSDYGSYDTVADLLRRIGLDERIHKEESIARMASPRFS